MILNNKAFYQIFIVPVIISFFLINCSARENSPMDYDGGAAMFSTNEKSFIEPNIGYAQADLGPNTMESKIQVNGSLSLEVSDIQIAMLEVKELVQKNSGRIISSDSGFSGRAYANINILVPNQLLDTLIESIKQISNKITNENIYTNDVTEEFIDVESRLNIMTETEKRFLDLLSETKNIEEIIQIETELMRIRSEIDSIKGRLEYLSKTTENSELSVYLVEEISISGDDKWNFGDSFENSLRSLISFIKGFTNFLISVIVFTPIIIFTLVVLYLFYRIAKKIRDK